MVIVGVASQDALYPNLSPTHPFVVVPNRPDSRVSVDGHPPFPAFVPVKAHRQASCPSIKIPPREASSQTSVSPGLLCRCRPNYRRAYWHVDQVVLGRKGPMGVRDILSFGGEEAVESASSTRLLGVDRDHQCRCLESTVGTLEEIPSEGNWEPGNSTTTWDALHAYGGPTACVK